jgi:ferredoxin
MSDGFSFSADAGACVGSGMCVLVAPAVFAQSADDGLVRVLDQEPPPWEHDSVREAAQLCPSMAITVAGG